VFGGGGSGGSGGGSSGGSSGGGGPGSPDLAVTGFPSNTAPLPGDNVTFMVTVTDKNGKPAPPSKPAGEDGLGDLVVEPNASRQQVFDSLDLSLGDIKKVETDKGLLKLKLAQQEITLSPIYLPTFTPIEGPQARRFANNYTRLFVRYPGLEDSKLGTEGMSGGEKFMMGYKIANASADIAMSGFTPISAISSVQDAISITRTIRAAMVSLSVSFATWEKSVDDQQQLLAGKSFKSIPTQPANLEFVQEMK